MRADDLDLAYTDFCRTMTALGEDRAELFLARFALLCIVHTGDLETVRRLIAEAAAFPETTESASTSRADIRHP